jgi:formylglycine-generating enzyme required for sulfatase activity
MRKILNYLFWTNERGYKIRNTTIFLLSIFIIIFAKTEPKAVEIFSDSVTGIEFVFVKGGCFEMGDKSGDGNNDEKPAHEVCVDSFWMGKYEVTQGQWEKIMGSNPSYYKAYQNGSNYPIESVRWNDVQDFIQSLNQRTGRRYRLPTEAEWEYAARNGGKRAKWAGTNSENELREYAWYRKNSADRTQLVGQKKPNGLGLYDMSGNVWEWCQDWYDWDYYKNSPRNNPKGPSHGREKLLRGGSWRNASKDIRTSARIGLDLTVRNYHSGFRLVLSSD